MTNEIAEGTHRTFRVVSATVGVALCHVFALGVFSTAAAFVRSTIPYFKDVNAKLPDIAIMAINLSLWMKCYWVLPLSILLPDVVGYFLLARLPYRFHWLATTWAILPLLFTILVLGVFVGGICLPLHDSPLR